MTRMKLEDIIRKSAASSSFEMPEDHLNQAMKMIQDRKSKRRFAFGIWSILGLSTVVLLWIFLGTSNHQLSNTTPVALSHMSTLSTSVNEDPLSEIKNEFNSTNEIVENEDFKVSSIQKSPVANSDYSTNEKDVKSINVTTNTVSKKEGKSDISYKLNENKIGSISILPIEKRSKENSTIVLHAEEVRIENPAMEFLFSTSSMQLLTIPEIELNKSVALRQAGNLIKWGMFVNADLYQLGSQNKGWNGLEVGVLIRKKISRASFISVEPSFQLVLNFSDHYLIQKVDNYGVEVVSQYYSLEPQSMINGKVSLSYGMIWRRWIAQVGPSLAFAPSAYGEIKSLKYDGNDFVNSGVVGIGWIKKSNSDLWSWGGDFSLMYRWTPRQEIGGILTYKNSLFYQKGDVRANSKTDEWNIGIRYNYLF